VNEALGIVAIVGMTAVALLGAVHPYRRPAVPEFEPPDDPLEDRRRTLLIAFEDLEAARETGSIEA